MLPVSAISAVVTFTSAIMCLLPTSPSRPTLYRTTSYVFYAHNSAMLYVSWMNCRWILDKVQLQ